MSRPPRDTPQDEDPQFMQVGIPPDQLLEEERLALAAGWAEWPMQQQDPAKEHCWRELELHTFSPAFQRLLCLLQLLTQHECCFCLLSRLLGLISQCLLGSSQLLAGGFCYTCSLLCCQPPGLHL